MIGQGYRTGYRHQGGQSGGCKSVEYDFAVSDKAVRGDTLLTENVHSRKIEQISQEIGKVPALAFGNSIGDMSMLNLCLSNQKYKTLAFMLIADDDERDHANREKALKLVERWQKSGYEVISMKDDFKTIYGDWVKKTDFKF